jgi:hypothetical protein
MTTGSCARLFEVEALRDGRLGGAERRSFERHIGACSVCARETQSLEKLAEAVRRGIDQEAGRDELRLWRERSRLLAAFDGALVSPNQGFDVRRLLLWPAAIAATVATIAIFWHGRPAVEPLRASRTSISADAGTVWSKRTGNASREEITLERGVLRIHVEHAPGRGGVVVRLPDGELEDVGTTFSVSVDGKHTTRVEVVEGEVALRLHDRPSVEIAAGDVWVAEAPTIIPPAIPAPALRVEAARERDRSVPHGSTRSVRSGETTVVPTPDPLVDFRTASAALRAGENRQAAAAFTRFLADHPGDPMAEDAAYLRVIAFQRMGADDDMKRAAEAYLERFPAGFRHAEVQRLAR